MNKTNKKPIIAIALDYVEDSVKYNYAPKPWYALRSCYSNMVEKVGGIPIFLPIGYDVVKDLLDFVDGVLVPGGDWDIDPKFYGEEILSEKVLFNSKRGEYTLWLIEEILKKNLPFLGICYGMQALNVLKGGSLIQDIPEFAPSSINHEQSAPKDSPSHEIIIEEGTKLFEIAGQKKIWNVNSTHHQAVKQLGNGIKLSASAPDGIIEAIELEDYVFAVGVEWHPEYNNQELDFNIFKSFVDAAVKNKLTYNN